MEDTPQTIRVGFIGAGVMSGAIIKRMTSANNFSRHLIINIYDHHPEKISDLSANLVPNCKELAQNSDIIFCGVKPHQVSSAMNELKPFWNHEKILVSICAGIPIDHFSQLMGQDAKIVRTMPSITCLTGKSSTALSSRNTSSYEISLVSNLLSCLGNIHFVEERLIDSITAISGSGPAFIGIFMDALIDAGVKNGLKRPLAKSLALETIEATCCLVNEFDYHPATIKDSVSSPSGTTIYGICALEREGFRNSVISAINDTVERAQSLKKA